MWQSHTTAIVVVAMFAGAVCGSIPLLVGLLRQRIGIGIGALLICVLSSLLFGLFIALAVSLFFSAGILRLTVPGASRSPVAADSVDVDNLRRVPLPSWCAWVFVVALLCLLISWTSVTSQIRARLYFGADETLWSVLSDEMGYAWLAVAFGVIGTALLLLRYRSADLLGWLSIICIMVAFVWPLVPLDGSSSTTAEHGMEAFLSEVLLIAWIAGCVIFGAALVRYRLWRLTIDAKAGTRTKAHRQFQEPRSGLGGPDPPGEQFCLPTFMKNARPSVEVAAGRVQVCPECRMRIVVSKEGECPSCRSSINKRPLGNDDANGVSKRSDTIRFSE